MLTTLRGPLSPLNSPPADGNAFGTIPPAGGNLVPTCTARPALPNAQINLPVQGLSISSLSGLTAVPGATVTIRVTPSPGVVPSGVVVSGPGVGSSSTTAPFDIPLTIPTGHVGPFSISAAAITAGGSLYSSNTITIQVGTSAALQSITLDPNGMVLTALGSNMRLSATGNYADGVARSLNGTGVATFSSSNSNIATVSADGIVTAVAMGYTTIRVDRGSVSNSVSVTVNPSANLPPPLADAGPDQGTIVGAAVTLPGSASGVPPGLTASYRWTQVSGPAVSLSGASSGTVIFTPSVASAYVFSLIVRAGLAESAPDNVTVTVGNPVAPTIQTNPSGVTARPGQTAVFTVVATGIPTPNYRWLKNGTIQVGTNANSLVLLRVRPADAGVYSVVVSNTTGSVTSAGATLTVQARRTYRFRRGRPGRHCVAQPADGGEWRLDHGRRITCRRGHARDRTRSRLGGRRDRRFRWRWDRGPPMAPRSFR